MPVLFLYNYVLVITSAGEGRILRDPLGEAFFVPGWDRRYFVLAGGKTPVKE